MSAPRPRPVTATVNHTKPAAAGGTYRPRKNVTLLSSSSGSTESLISCINDISASLDSKQEYKENVHNQNNNNAMDDGTDDTSKSQIVSCSAESRSETEPTTVTQSSSQAGVVLGAWEKWMIQKTEQLKQLQDQKSKLVKLRNEQKNLEELQKKEREQKAVQKRQEWLALKNEEFEKAERRRLLREKRKQKEEEQRKRDVEIKSQQRYSEWMNQKRKTEALRRALEMEQQKLKEMELKEKKDRSDMAFQAWLEKASSRTRLHHHTYAKCDGVLTGYYNTAASPSPSYYNPIPWQPIAVPPSMKEKSRKQSRRKTPKNAWTINN